MCPIELNLMPGRRREPNTPLLLFLKDRLIAWCRAETERSRGKAPTQREIARRAGLSVAAVNNVLQAKSADLSVLTRLASLFGVQASRLLADFERTGKSAPPPAIERYPNGARAGMLVKDGGVSADVVGTVLAEDWGEADATVLEWIDRLRARQHVLKHGQRVSSEPPPDSQKRSSRPGGPRR